MTLAIKVNLEKRVAIFDFESLGKNFGLCLKV